MKRVAYNIFFISIILLTTIACNEKDAHSLGEFRVDIATIIPEGNEAYSLQLDNGNTLWPVASDVKYSPKYNQRVFVNYTTLSGEKNGYSHYVKVNDIWNVLTKSIIELTPQNADSIGNDPIKINAAWVSNNFLNIDFMFNYGGTKAHAINLVRNSNLAGYTDKPIELEFRHNAFDSQNYRLYEGFVCFDLKQLKNNNSDSVKINIKVKDLDGEKNYPLVYKYNQSVEKNTIAETPIPVISSNEYY